MFCGRKTKLAWVLGSDSLSFGVELQLDWYWLLDGMVLLAVE